MDELTKYRITGAVIWLGLLIIFVPGWYASPVDFSAGKDVFSVKGLTADEKTIQSQAIQALNPTQDKKPAQSPVKSETNNVKVAPPASVTEERQISTSGQWLVRVASYGNIQSAHRVVNQLENRYKVTIGDFSNEERRLYSVRVGPFDNLAEAQRAKAELDREFSVDALIVKIR